MTLWLPETKAFEPILNRAEAQQHASRHLSKHVDALSALVDYGTHLIPRCWNSSPKTIRDLVVLPVLLKQVVTMLDAATELLSRACVEPAMLQLRSAFEASVYLDWILQSKSPTRARAYYVWNIRRGLRWNNRGLNGTPEHRAFKKEMAGLSFVSQTSTPRRQRELAAEAARLSQHLAGPKNVAWNRRFDVMRRGRPYDVDWYQVLFKRRRSLSHLAKSVHRLPEYRMVYERGSESMHSSSSGPHVRVLKGGKLEVRSLRELTDFPFLFQMLMATGLRAYRAALDEYRPGEAENFALKYVDSWREVFMTTLDVEYKYHRVTIGS